MTGLPGARDLRLWERWTIDELFDDVARILVCRATPLPGPLDTIEATRAGAGGRIRGAADSARSLRAAVAEAEMRGGGAWTDEEWSYADVVPLAALLERRAGKPGLPHNRPLREGDVFLVVVDAGRLLAAPLSEAGRSGVELATALAAYEAAGPEVFDVTAAARQSAKVLHDAAMRATARLDRRG